MHAANQTFKLLSDEIGVCNGSEPRRAGQYRDGLQAGKFVNYM